MTTSIAIIIIGSQINAVRIVTRSTVIRIGGTHTSCLRAYRATHAVIIVLQAIFVGILFANHRDAIIIEMPTFGTRSDTTRAILTSTTCPSSTQSTVIRLASAMMKRIGFAAASLGHMHILFTRSRYTGGIDTSGIRGTFHIRCSARRMATAAMIVVIPQVDACIVTLSQ